MSLAFSLGVAVSLVLMVVGGLGVYLASPSQRLLGSVRSPRRFLVAGGVLWGLAFLVLGGSMQGVAAAFTLVTWGMVVLMVWPVVAALRFGRGGR
ncbi:hypothetical protein [Pararhodospirillum photometricum]|nr:hypothetical protein [Pararhodospirillum photometricum]